MKKINYIIYTHVHVNTYVHVHVNTYVHVHVYTYVHVYTHITYSHNTTNAG